MSVRKLRKKQRGAKCSWCNARAAYRGFMFGRYACAEHLSELEAWDKRETTPDYSDAAFQLKY